jgi:hypothetical protein
MRERPIFIPTRLVVAKSNVSLKSIQNEMVFTWFQVALHPTHDRLLIVARLVGGIY